MNMDREQESFALNHQAVDPAIALVAAARAAEAAFHAALAINPDAPDTADDAIYDALAVTPTTLEGVRAKIEMALKIEGPGWDDDAATLLRSLLASPALNTSAT